MCKYWNEEHYPGNIAVTSLCFQKYIAQNRSLGPDDTTTDGEKIVGDTLYRETEGREEKAAERGKGTSEEEEREFTRTECTARRGTAQPFSPDNRQLEERGGCRGG